MKVTKQHLLVKRKEAEQTTAGGILLPEQATRKPLQGTILKKGIEVTIPVEIGDEVLFDAFAGSEVTIDDTRYLVLDEADVLVILDKK